MQRYLRAHCNRTVPTSGRQRRQYGLVLRRRRGLRELAAMLTRRLSAAHIKCVISPRSRFCLVGFLFCFASAAHSAPSPEIRIYNHLPAERTDVISSSHVKGFPAFAKTMQYGSTISQQRTSVARSLSIKLPARMSHSTTGGGKRLAPETHTHSSSLTYVWICVCVCTWRMLVGVRVRAHNA